MRNIRKQMRTRENSRVCSPGGGGLVGGGGWYVERKKTKEWGPRQETCGLWVEEPWGVGEGSLHPAR